MSKDLFVLKIGGSVITDRSQIATPLKESIFRVCAEIFDAQLEHDFNLILVNGAGSYGHIAAMKHGLKRGFHNEDAHLGAASVHHSVENLNRIIWDILLKLGVVSVPVHPSSCVVQDDGELVKFDTEVVERLIENNFVPLLYGDVVSDRSIGASIISGDVIAPYLARELGAKKLLLGSDTDGVFDKDPNIFPGAKLVEEISDANIDLIFKGIGESTHQDVTGGMRGKIMRIREFGVPAVVFNATKNDTVKRALLGEKLGTLIKP